MGLESTTTIQGLDATFPTSGDPRSQGDDHLRLIKSVLKSIFPGSTGLGMTVPITAKEADLNNAFTTGVKAPFYQAAAPTGWTISNPGTNYTLVSAAVGGTVAAGNGDLVTGCTIVPDHAHAQQGSFASGISNQSLNHSHAFAGNIAGFQSFFSGTGGGAQSQACVSTGSLGNASGFTDLSSHNHNITISGQTSAVNQALGTTTGIGKWQPAVANVIICLKS